MERVTHFSSPDKPWGKARTPKRYIHPPFAENIITMWPNTTIMIGETEGGANPQRSVPGRSNESKLPAAAMAFVYRDRLLDYQNAEYCTRDDGIPVHKIIQNLGDFTLEMESFCNSERVPTAFTRLKIRNNTNEVLVDKLQLIARTALEFDILGVREPDGYMVPEPSIYRWLMQPMWTHEEKKMTDKTYSVYYQAGKGITIDPKDWLYVNFMLQLQPGEETYIDFAFGRCKINEDFSYEAELKKTEAFWEGELSKIKVFPMKEDPYYYAVVRSLVAQGLQMFHYPKGVNYVILRQGGLQRLLWPADVRSMIRALARMGDFDEYIDAIFNTYFHVMQSSRGDNEGEIVNFGIPWGAVTGSVLFAFGAAAQYSEKLYNKYKDNAYAAFRWMEKQRDISKADPSLAYGLFPPFRNSDEPTVGQIWSRTDTWNIQGYALYAQALETRQDPHREEVQAAFADYMNCVKAVAQKVAEANKDSDAMTFPNDARMDPEIEAVMNKKALATKYRCGSDLRLLNIGALGFDTPEARKILKYHMEDRHTYENGLTYPFGPSVISKKGRRWYGSWVDMEMYYYFRRIGDDQKAKEILDAQLNYIMTNEYYMMERYDDSDSWYSPWCPNCSANGRTLSMLCDWFIDREKK